MRRASRDYTKYLRGSEEMGGAGAPHEGPLHAPPPPATPAAAAASRSTFVALLGLGLGQVVCSVALFLYFRAQVSARPTGRAGGARPPRPASTWQEVEFGSPPRPRPGFPGSCIFRRGKGLLNKRERVTAAQPGAGPGALASVPAGAARPGCFAEAGLARRGAFEFPPSRPHWSLTSFGNDYALFSPSVSFLEQRMNLLMFT